MSGWMVEWGDEEEDERGGRGGKRGVKIKSKENESPSPHSRSGYKYIHVDACVRARIRFSARGWHYISFSVGGVMPAMYNSSARDSTWEMGMGGVWCLPPPQLHQECLRFSSLFISLLIQLFIYFPPSSKPSVSQRWRRVRSDKTANRLQVVARGSDWRWQDEGGRLDRHSSGAEARGGVGGKGGM